LDKVGINEVAIGLRGDLEGHLEDLGLRLRPTKTSAPTPVSDAVGLYDLLGEIKYGAAGLLSQPAVWEQYSLEDLRAFGEDLLGAAQFDVHRLDEVGKHLRLYLEWRRQLAHGQNDETAVRLAQKAIEACSLRPRDLLTCIQVALSQYGGSAQLIRAEVLERIPHGYGRIVLAQALGWPQEAVDRDASVEVLRELSRRPDSYLVHEVT
jgi:hypothetical protein